MISERRFASSFSSFWQELLPSGEAVVRAINLNKSRFLPPLSSTIKPTRRAFVNETAFLLFKASKDRMLSPKEVCDLEEVFDSICDQAQMTVQRFRGYKPSSLSAPNVSERTEIVEIAQRLQSFFASYETDETVIASPEFLGCGFIDSCCGDVIVGETLYEVKAGERSFRLVDIRQVLVYLALSHASERYEIQKIGFLNPRMGIFYSTSVNELTIQMSGRHAVEILSDIIEFISSGDISR